MNKYDLLIAASAVAAYGISSAIQIELRDGRRMTAVGAFGPALIALSGYGFQAAPLAWLISGALIAEAVALVVTHQSVRVLVLHAVALFVAAGVFAAVVAQKSITGRPALLIAAAASSAIYLALEATRRESGEGHVGRLRDRLLEAAPVHAVLVSTAGLTVLALPSLGWATFPIVVVPLLATAHEFGNFGKTRRTFDETVRALASLVEGAGYAPDGHHERVAQLSVAMARECGLSSKQVRELELVALLHDVGAVSLSEPQVLAFTDPSVVAERSAEFVEETGYLAGHGQTVREAAHAAPSTLQASILRLADIHDETGRDGQGNSSALESALELVDASVKRAFRHSVRAGATT